MTIAIPILSDQGLESPLCAHLGRSPFWLLTDGLAYEVRRNPVAMHSCQKGLPFAANEVDTILCFRVGTHHFQRLSQQGLRFYRTRARTVAEALAQWQQHEPPLITEPGPARIPCPSL